jgi:hypothetical protein
MTEKKKAKATIEIINIFRTSTNSPLFITIKYGPENNQFVTLTEGDKFDIRQDAMVEDEE